MDPARKNVAALVACQALLLTSNSILITVNGLAGYDVNRARHSPPGGNDLV
jgi:hypothetical protein